MFNLCFYNFLHNFKQISDMCKSFEINLLIRNYILLIAVLITTLSPINSQNDYAIDDISEMTTVQYNATKHGEISRDSVFVFKYLTYRKFYNRMEEISKNIYLNQNGSIDRILVQKNKDTKPLQGKTYDASENLIEYWELVYNDYGDIITYKTYNHRNELLSFQKNEYNKDTTLKSRTTTYQKSNKIYKTEFQYNTNKEVLKESIYRADGTIRTIYTYKYDEEGRETYSHMSSSDSKAYNWSTSKYDKYGNLIEQIWHDEHDDAKHQISFEYVYDTKKNWITKKQYDDKKISFVWEIKIKY